MWRTLLNAPWPETGADGDIPERVQAQAAQRIRRYWLVQMLLLTGGMVVLWLYAEHQELIYHRAYLVPVILNALICMLGLIRFATSIWLITTVGALAFQGMLVDGLGGVTAVSFMLPYTFAAMMLPGRRRLAIQALCVIAFWFSLFYEILPGLPQLAPPRLIFVSYNILVATLTFQVLRFLNRLAVELNTAHVAEEVTQRSQQFLARVSHELRTPLNSVLGFAKMMRRGDLPEPHASYLEQIVEEGEQLNRLVSDLLDSAHLATGKLKLTLARCDVNAVCRSAADEVRALLQPGVALRLDLAPDLPPIDADELRLSQIVRNLAVNAAKYTVQGEVGVSTAHRGGAILIAVRDTGPGIPPEAHEFVFVPFVKRDNRSAGVGLGLDIARQLARLHGGDIRLESEGRLGSLFTVELPITSAAREKAAEAQRIASPDAGSVV
ncbi:MAG: HAMP domain-containing histidine kinase [Anaerolineae bacterium]|nr:HAMP domain-containing histidine kinase [Anaerolineae bacterium]